MGTFSEFSSVAFEVFVKEVFWVILEDEGTGVVIFVELDLV
jgi:hypothetical protein